MKKLITVIFSGWLSLVGIVPSIAQAAPTNLSSTISAKSTAQSRAVTTSQTPISSTGTLPENVAISAYGSFWSFVSQVCLYIGMVIMIVAPKC